LEFGVETVYDWVLVWSLEFVEKVAFDIAGTCWAWELCIKIVGKSMYTMFGVRSFKAEKHSSSSSLRDRV